MPYVVFKRYQANKLIKKNVLAGFDKRTQCEIAIKMEYSLKRNEHFSAERQFYSSAAGQNKSGLPLMHTFGLAEGFNMVVLDRLGDNLFDIFERHNRKFSLKTVLMIADQLLRRIEMVHSIGYVHRNVEPKNFCIGAKDPHNIYVIDFGLSRAYLDAKTGMHEDYHNMGYHTDQTLFTSLERDLFKVHNRRDDLESIGFVLIYFLNNGKLPWAHISKNYSGEELKEQIISGKMKDKLLLLCADLPDEFCDYVLQVRSLKYNARPNYDALRSIFQKLFEQLHYAYDDVYDWTAPKPIVAKFQTAAVSAAEVAKCQTAAVSAAEVAKCQTAAASAAEVAKCQTAAASAAEVAKCQTAAAAQCYYKKGKHLGLRRGNEQELQDEIDVDLKQLITTQADAATSICQQLLNINQILTELQNGTEARSTLVSAHAAEQQRQIVEEPACGTSSSFYGAQRKAAKATKKNVCQQQHGHELKLSPSEEEACRIAKLRLLPRVAAATCTAAVAAARQAKKLKKRKEKAKCNKYVRGVFERLRVSSAEMSSDEDDVANTRTTAEQQQPTATAASVHIAASHNHGIASLQNFCLPLVSLQQQQVTAAQQQNADDETLFNDDEEIYQAPPSISPDSDSSDDELEQPEIQRQLRYNSALSYYSNEHETPSAQGSGMQAACDNIRQPCIILAENDDLTSDA